MTLTFDLLIKNRSMTHKLKCELLTVQDHILSTSNIRNGESFASIFFCIDKIFYFYLNFFFTKFELKKIQTQVVTSTALINVSCFIFFFPSCKNVALSIFYMTFSLFDTVNLRKDTCKIIKVYNTSLVLSWLGYVSNENFKLSKNS